MSTFNSKTTTSGLLTGKLYQSPPNYRLTAKQLLDISAPKRGLPEEVNDFRSDNRKNIKSGLEPIKWAEKKNVSTFYGRLWGRKITTEGEVLDFGLLGLKKVTTAGVAKIVSLLNTADGTTGINFKYHALGTSSTAEANTDTALIAEITTQYAVDSTRPAGTQTTNGNDTYRTVGVNTVDGSVACTEHGIFSAATAGTLLDRTVFSVVNLGATDTYQTTYDLQIAAEA